MSKFIILPFLVIAVFGSLLAARSGAFGLVSDDSRWPTSQEVAYGESVTLPDGSVLEFVEVVEDSRCPADAMCIWQGRAVVAFEMNGERFKVAFLGEPASVEVGEYTVTVHEVQPYPLASQPTEHSEYVVTVSVSKA
jgi:hypothetical protein